MIYVDGEVAGYESHPEGTLTVEQANNLMKFGVEAPTEEILQEHEQASKLAMFRATRNRMLKDTDWWVLPDRTPTQAQLDYRQALRDITETYTSLDDVVWPEEPV